MAITYITKNFADNFYLVGPPSLICSYTWQLVGDMNDKEKK